ncbi:alanine racemase pyridoxal-phosphate attachment site [Lucifera butyrica]|uniref:Alanine racemase n=1 Tax=Lucifera butyrica TaxID=1351585 RepID=A0A498R3T1_9FIRM|nr:alanine racemase [Lucifera butyrica]VBB05819.1 alanine racemase pyridoxal-phosphate attachment site [Lucifera butyrica]
MRPTYVEIDLTALRHNMTQIRSVIPSAAGIMAVVKADAYGHGAVPVSRTVLAAGASSLAVAIPEEGAELREAGLTVPILVLGLTLPEQAHSLVENNLTATVCTLEQVNALAAAAREVGKSAQVMIKTDTGMGRIGIPPAQVLPFIRQLLAIPEIKVQGLFTHMAAADEKDKRYANFQITAFRSVLADLKSAGINPLCVSAANSAGIIDLPDSHFTAVRPGIILYGLPPSHDMHRSLDLHPVMSLKTKIVYIKQVPAATAISYGCTYQTSRETYIATLPLGYADGYSRQLSNKASVLIGGKRCPVVGRVCMDQILVDLGTECSSRIGDEAVLFGKQGSEEITVTELADLAATINYELVCAISPRVPRIYIG